MTNENKENERSKDEILLERKRLKRLQSVGLAPEKSKESKDKKKCEYIWHSNPGILVVCPFCGEK